MTNFNIHQGAEFIASLSGKDTSYDSKWGKEPNGKNSVFKKWFFDVQWSDCPDEVQEEVIESWRDYELGNDRYFWTATLDEELFETYPRIYFWLEHKGVPKGEEVIVHWWW